jgi:hypothetical protein
MIGDRAQMGKCLQGCYGSRVDGCAKGNGRFGQGHTGMGQPEVARRAVMKETRVKRDCSGPPNSGPDSARARNYRRSDG